MFIMSVLSEQTCPSVHCCTSCNLCFTSPAVEFEKINMVTVSNHVFNIYRSARAMGNSLKALFNVAFNNLSAAMDYLCVLPAHVVRALHL